MIEIKRRWRIVSSVAFPGFALVALLATVYAQQQVSQTNSGGDLVVQSKQLGVVPSSGSSGPKVTLRLTFDAGTDTEVVFKVTQFEGSTIRVEGNGSTIGIVPHIDTEHANQVTAKVFRLVPVDAREISVGERIAEVSLIEIGREASNLPIGDFGVRVEVIGIAFEVQSANERKKISQVHLLNAGICCVNCSGYSVCACAVEGPCGSCCTGSCC